MSSFNDPDAVANYAAGPRRLVPGFEALQRMTAVLLAERVPVDAHVLVHGAGGGLEPKVFAKAHPGWRFTGIDPSAPMLDLARQTLGPLISRVSLQEGYIDTAPPGPFDGATSLLVLHFLPRAERLATLTALRQRLKPGAPLIAAHHSVPKGEEPQWFARFAAFAIASGVAPDMALKAAADLPTALPFLSPAEDAALLAEAGFTNIQLFYAAFTFRGWVCTAP
jgi:tRNA (cmo5U34)-methyltransferase